MQIELEDRIFQQLAAIAKQTGRDVNLVAAEAVENYIEQHGHEDELRAEVRAVLKKHAGLFERLAKS